MLHVLLCDPHAAKILFKVCHECRADVLILAAHDKPYSLLNQLTLGSVAEYVREHAKARACAVHDSAALPIACSLWQP